MIFKHLRRKSLLNESRKMCPCHTFQSDASEIFTPTCSLSTTHAKRCNSCRSGAWPTMPKPYPCRARRHRKPHQGLAIITIGREIGLVPLEKHHASHPRGRASAKPEGKRRNRAKRAHPSEPPFGPSGLERGAGWGGGWKLWVDRTPAPLALFTSSWPNEAARTRSKPTTDARPAPCGGGGLPLPAAAAAAPFFYKKKQRIEKK